MRRQVAGGFLRTFVKKENVCMSNRRIFLTAIAITCVVTGSGSSQDAEDQYRSRFEKLVSGHKESMEKAKTIVVKAFDLQVQRLERTSKKEVRALAALEQIVEAREQFKELDKLPKRSVLTQHIEAYERKARSSLARTLTDVNSLANKASANGLVDLAKELIEDGNKLKHELADKFPVRPWYKVEHVVNGRDRATWLLYSDGTVDKNSSVTWESDGSRLVFRIKDPAAPGGAWVDACVINANRDGFDGRNQEGARISGSIKLVED